jgi:putative hydrolase of the HAD superfamily
MNCRRWTKLDWMTRAVLFDFYGTLAHWQDHEATNYATVFAAHGYDLPTELADAYFALHDGVEHTAHSVDQETYEAWVRHRLSELSAGCGVPAEDQDAVVDALRASDQGLMVAYPEAASTLLALREAGWTIGVCSNWGWELDAFLIQVELFTLIDLAVTSARTGARKPHPSIYDHVLETLGVAAHECVFVGDSWGPDVEGPRQAGMTAVHVWRPEERPGPASQALAPGMHRIGDLSELLPLLNDPVA